MNDYVFESNGKKSQRTSLLWSASQLLALGPLPSLFHRLCNDSCMMTHDSLSLSYTHSFITRVFVSSSEEILVMSDKDVVSKLQALTKLIEEQNKAVNSRLDKIEKKVAQSGGCIILLCYI